MEENGGAQKSAILWQFFGNCNAALGLAMLAMFLSDVEWAKLLRNIEWATLLRNVECATLLGNVEWATLLRNDVEWATL